MTRARQGAGLRRCGAWVAAMLAVTWAAGASAADRIRIEIDGVDGAIRDNVRGYVALTRFAQRDDLTDAQVRRLADRAVDEAAARALRHKLAAALGVEEGGAAGG